MADFVFVLSSATYDRLVLTFLRRIFETATGFLERTFRPPPLDEGMERSLQRGRVLAERYRTHELEGWPIALEWASRPPPAAARPGASWVASLRAFAWCPTLHVTPFRAARRGGPQRA